MNQSLDTTTLTKYVAGQLNNALPDTKVTAAKLSPFVKKAMKRVEHCFSRINDKYFFDGKNVVFDHLHTDQYAMFLYYLSNTIWESTKDRILAGKVYCLNKAMHSVDAFYEVKLPDIFRLVHPLGTVLGRGTYGDYFVAYQRVTVGGNMDFVYPQLGKKVIMYGNSTVIGKCRVGDGCVLALGSVVMDQDIPPNTLIVSKYFGAEQKEMRKDHLGHFFKI